MPIDLLHIRGLKDFRTRLKQHPVKRYSMRPIAAVTHIAVHHSATRTGSAEAYARYHVEQNGWPGIGYHLVIEQDGTIKWCHDLEVKSYHVGDSNRKAVGVCLTGDFSKGVPTAAQWTSLSLVLKALRDLLGVPVDNVWGHQEFPGYASKACPSLNMDLIRKNLRKPVPLPAGSPAPNPALVPTVDPVAPSPAAGPGIQVQPSNKQARLNTILNALKRKGVPVNQNPSKAYNLNIVGIRSANRISNSFDDALCVFWKQDSAWQFREYKATTDPGLYWLENPMNSAGTAILKPGHYPKSHRLGLHRGQYPALVQAGPLTVYRDFNRDRNIDWNNGKEQTGYFGINIHRSNASAQSTLVGKWSAGCQVFANPNDFKEFMQLANQAAANWGETFSYTLLEASDL